MSGDCSFKLLAGTGNVTLCQRPQGIVAVRTGFGGRRIVDMLVGEQLPRICQEKLP